MKTSLHHSAPNNPLWSHSQWWCGSEGWVQLGYKKDGCLGILSGSNSNRQLHHHHQHGIEILSRNRRNNNSVGIVLSWVDQCWNIFWQLQAVDKYVDYGSMNVANILINVTNILMAVWLWWWFWWWWCWDYIGVVWCNMTFSRCFQCTPLLSFRQMGLKSQDPNPTAGDADDSHPTRWSFSFILGPLHWSSNIQRIEKYSVVLY